MTADGLVPAWRRLARELAARGHPRAGLAAAVLACRGRLLLDVAGFARLLGVDAGHVRSLEAGRRRPDAVPRRLVELAPDLDWAALGVRAGGPTDPARRHPSAGTCRSPPGRRE